MNTRPKRLLCIVGSMNAGGAETFLMKIYRTLDKSKYQMDFYVTTQNEGFYDREILLMGGKIFRSVPKSKGFLMSFKAIKNVVRNENYQYVLRISQHSLSTLDLLAAKLGGAQTLVFRSSNSSTGGGWINRALHNLFKWLPMTIPTVKIAPSTEAAEFMFGKKCVKKGKATIVNNAIPLDKFMFKQYKRDKIRSELNIKDEFVVGHIGRFNFQKNHNFLIYIFAEIVKKHNNSKLVLVGKGELEKDIKEKIKNQGLNNKVVFMGVRADIPDIMMAFDVFIFPSLFEGLPNTVIEAQATGLPCIISDAITKEVKITDLVKYISLRELPIKWADTALKYKDVDRKSVEETFIIKGYDIESTTKRLEQLIFKDNSSVGCE